jgi:predicted phosphoadenosine phosphosulfate sulfurtransferase
MKKYLDKNVYEAFVERINYIFDEFQAVYVSFSGGKDSSVMIQLTNQIASERGRKFDVFFLDFEAQYQMTIDHVYELKGLSQINDFYHFCLPLENEDNPSSIFRPTWIPWNEAEKDLWVRPMPVDAINISTVDPEIFKRGQEWEDLLKQFPRYIKKKYGVDNVAALIGIRTDESFHRFRSIAFGINLYKDKNFSTEISKGVYNFYPIYDWATEDIWHAVNRYNLKYNKVYEHLWKMGVPISQQRICHPYGQDQRVSLNQWAQIEPDTWAKIVSRVAGANFGALYAKTSLLGHNGTNKPAYMSWEQYAVFLLESLGLYSEDLKMHYVRKIKILFEYIKEQAAIQVKDIEDDKPSEADNLKDWISWKRIARTIEKNDYQCRGLHYGLTKTDKETMQKLKNKWGTLLGLEHYKEKTMKDLAKEIGYGTEF